MNKKCQVFTPLHVVSELLDYADFSADVFGKKILENSCGNGNVLSEIVRRYIIDGLNKKESLEKIKIGLENDIFAFEIDVTHYQNCIKRLTLIAKDFNIIDVKWNIINENFLEQEFDFLFDYIIGNPPYINYRDLNETIRNSVRKNFNSCKFGKFDYCYPFIEKSIAGLCPNGVLAYIIPNSIFKNVFANELRKIIIPHTEKIINFTGRKIFDGKLTASTILLCKKDSNKTEIEYTDYVNSNSYVLPKLFINNKCFFLQNYSVKDKKKRFGDCFNASMSVATLLNEVFVLKKFSYENDFIILEKHKIEMQLTKNAVGPRSLNLQNSELIIFPYNVINDKVLRYDEAEFEKLFPQGAKYLKLFADRLANRTADNSTHWFEYGRSQALSHLFQEKLILSTIVTNSVKVYSLNKETVPYSGIVITKKDSLDLDIAKKILTSNDFLSYVSGIGINASGKSIRITASDINNYMFNL